MVLLLPSAIPRVSGGSISCPIPYPCPHPQDTLDTQGPLTTPSCDPYNGHLSVFDSQGSDQQIGSGKDTGDIHYASFTHLEPFSLEDPIYVNTRPGLKPTPDLFLAVEYASITKTEPSAPADCPGGAQDLKAEVTLQ